MAYEVAVRQLRYGLIVEWSGGWLVDRSEERRKLNPRGRFLPLSPMEILNPPQTVQTHQTETLPNPPIPVCSLLLLLLLHYYYYY